MTVKALNYLQKLEKYIIDSNMEILHILASSMLIFLSHCY